MFTVNKELCIGCKACVEECPTFLLKMDEDLKAVFVDGASKQCIRCGHCEAVCPTSAAMAHFEPTELMPTKNLSDFPSIDELKSVVLQRRSIRSFKKKPVDDGIIRDLLDTVRFAPTAKNTETLQWILVNSREEVVKLADLTIETLKGKKDMLPVVRAYQQGVDVIMRNAPQLLVAVASSEASSPVIDATIALTTFEMLAAASEVGTCWAGFFLTAAMGNPAIGKSLGIEEPFRIYGAMLIGSAKHRFFRIPLRKELMLTVR